MILYQAEQPVGENSLVAGDFLLQLYEGINRISAI